jgi:hypothetical protein
MVRAAAALLAAIAILAACKGNPPPVANQSPDPSTSATPSAAAIVASPTPSASPANDLPLSRVTFSCRLPVLTTSQYQDGVTITGGFLTFPAATYQADPRGTLISRPTGDMVTGATPVLVGIPQTGPPFYDLAMKRWLPAGSGQASPDGTRYAYSVPGPSSSDPTQVHVVQVADGSDHVVSIAPPPTGVGWQVEDFDGRSVYLAIQMVDQFPAGVWRLDVATGLLHQLAPTSAGHVQLVQSGIAWVGLVDPADPSPPQLPKGEPFDSLASIDLATGATTTWVYRPGQAVMFVDVDSSGHPVVMVLPPPFDHPVPMVLVSSPGNIGVAIEAPFYQLGLTEADTGRLWFSGSKGVYYWTLATGLIKVYAFKGDPSLQQSIAPAGHCV